MHISREQCVQAEKVASSSVRFDLEPIQLGMGGSPWRVIVASQLFQRARNGRIERVLEELLKTYPEAAWLARADMDRLVAILKPCGLHLSRARQLVRMSSAYTSDVWSDLRDLAGVGPYVLECVAKYCLG